MKQNTVEMVSKLGKYAFGFLILSWPIGQLIGNNDSQEFSISASIFLLSFAVIVASALALLVDKIRNG